MTMAYIYILLPQPDQLPRQFIESWGSNTFCEDGPLQAAMKKYWKPDESKTGAHATNGVSLLDAEWATGNLRLGAILSLIPAIILIHILHFTH